MLTYMETGVQHRATNFEPAIEEIWQLLDPARADDVLFEHTLDVLKIAEMAKKLAPVDSPYDRDLALPSCYGNARELGEPKWLQKAVRRERNDQKIGALNLLSLRGALVQKTKTDAEARCGRRGIRREAAGRRRHCVPAQQKPRSAAGRADRGTRLLGVSPGDSWSSRQDKMARKKRRKNGQRRLLVCQPGCQQAQLLYAGVSTSHRHELR
jgi:hypothetical protein